MKLESMSSELAPVEGYYQGVQRVGPSHEETHEFVEYWRAIMLRKWYILAFAGLVAAITYGVISNLTPIYRSTATLLVETDLPKLVPLGDAYNGAGSYYREYFQTQAEVLSSHAVAQRVIEGLKLYDHPEFDPRQRKPGVIETWINSNFPSIAAAFRDPVELDQRSIADDVLKNFAERLSVEPIRLSQLIKVGFMARDPDLAAAIANATAQAYIQADLDARYVTGENSGQMISRQLAELKAKLDSSEMALQAYREREGILDNKSTVLGGTGKQLDELTQRLVDARVRRSEAEQIYRQLKASAISNYETAPAVINSAAVQQAKQVEAEAQKKVAEISQRFGPDHPNFIAANSELSSARVNTQRRIQNLVASVAKDYEAARATEKAIEAALAESKGTIQSLNRKDIQLGVLEREAATNRQLYQTFLSSFKETSAIQDTQRASARLVDPAGPAVMPIRPDKKGLMVSIAAVLSLFFGMMVSLLMRSLNNNVITSGDVERKLQQPFLAALPILSRKDRKKAARAVLDHPNESFAESIRTASTGILLSALDAQRRIIVVTSSAPREGRSTFAINLAFSQAKTRRVLLIEGDMRHPCFGKVMNLSREQKGLSQLLSGACTFDECLLRIEGTDLDIIPAGPVPQNPMELLSSRKFHDLLAMLRNQCDMVIIDTPSVQSVSDALVIGSQSSGIIHIVRADHTPAPLARAGLKRIISANIPVFGVVLNQQNFKRAKKYYGECSNHCDYGYGPPHRRSAGLGAIKYWVGFPRLTHGEPRMTSTYSNTGPR